MIVCHGWNCIINLRMIQQLMPQIETRNHRLQNFCLVSLQNKEFVPQRAEEMLQGAYSRFRATMMSKAFAVLRVTSSCCIIRVQCRQEIQGLPTLQALVQNTMDAFLSFLKAHSHLIIYVLISCSTKKFSDWHVYHAGHVRDAVC